MSLLYTGDTIAWLLPKPAGTVHPTSSPNKPFIKCLKARSQLWSQTENSVINNSLEQSFWEKNSIPVLSMISLSPFNFLSCNMYTLQKLLTILRSLRLEKIQNGPVTGRISRRMVFWCCVRWKWKKEIIGKNREGVTTITDPLLPLFSLILSVWNCNYFLPLIINFYLKSKSQRVKARQVTGININWEMIHTRKPIEILQEALCQSSPIHFWSQDPWGPVF